MNDVKVQSVLKALKAQALPENFEFLLEVGEIPYQANYDALTQISMRRNAELGLQKVQEAIDGLDSFINEVEFFRDAAKTIAKQAASAIRSA